MTEISELTVEDVIRNRITDIDAEIESRIHHRELWKDELKQLRRERRDHLAALKQVNGHARRQQGGGS